jgi:hypothetical protein
VRTRAGYYRLVYRWRRVRGPLRRVLIVALLVFLLGAFAWAVFNGVIGGQTDIESGETAPTAEMHGLSFTGVRARTAATSGRDFVTGRKKRAKGVFVVVTFNATNVGDEPSSVIVEPRLKGANGKEYSSSEALLAQGWVVELQPEFSDRLSVTFDVPRTAARRGARLRLEACEAELVGDAVAKKSCRDSELPLALR